MRPPAGGSGCWRRRVPPPCLPGSPGPGRSVVLLDEGQGCFGYVLPAAVEDQGVAAVGDLLDVSGGAIALLLFVGGAGDRVRGEVVLLAGDDQHGAAVRVLGAGLRLRERVDVGGRGLEERDPGAGDGIGLIQPPGLVLADRVGESGQPSRYTAPARRSALRSCAAPPWTTPTSPSPHSSPPRPAHPRHHPTTAGSPPRPPSPS